MILKELLVANDEVVVSIFRIVLGIILFPHGTQKLFGWFGGDGIKGTVAHMDHVGVPKIVSYLTIFGQSFGSFALILGFLTRYAAGGVFLIMAGAMFINLSNGWLMNWTGKKKGEGIEYFVLFLAINCYVLFYGAGPWSLDYLLFNN